VPAIVAMRIEQGQFVLGDVLLKKIGWYCGMDVELLNGTEMPVGPHSWAIEYAGLVA